MFRTVIACAVVAFFAYRWGYDDSARGFGSRADALARGVEAVARSVAYVDCRGGVSLDLADGTHFGDPDGHCRRADDGAAE